jgi:iron complex transport system permease protein
MLGLAAGSEGWSFAWAAESDLVWAIRAPRSVGALLTGALLGLAGALAQGLFRNPLADPYLLGSAAGAGLGVVLVLAAGGCSASVGLATAGLLLRTGLVGAAFAGALGGVALTLVLARGAAAPRPAAGRCGGGGAAVGGVGARDAGLARGLAGQAGLHARHDVLSELVQRGRAGRRAGGQPAGGLLLARALDALVLGEASAASLGLPLPRLRLLLVVVMALATGTAVAQAGLVAFVGLVAPHIVRRLVVATHASCWRCRRCHGAVLLLAADVAARSVVAPQELPVGLLTAVLRRRLPAGAAAPAEQRVKPALLSAEGLSLRLGDNLAVDGVSLALHGGQWAAIVGPNGAGKSTLLALLAGLRQPDAGCVRLGGRPLAEWPARERAQQLAWLAQQGDAEGEIAALDVVRLGRLPRHGLFGAPDAATKPPWSVRWPRPRPRPLPRAA